MKIACPKCQKKLDCPERLAGKAGQCPKCKSKFRIPGSARPPIQDQQLIVKQPPVASPPPYDHCRNNDPEPAPASAVPEREALYRDEYVTVWPDGSADFHFGTPGEGKVAIKGLRLFKKQLRIHLKVINANLREVRHEYTDYTRRRGSMVRGGGSLGHILRFVETYSRDMNRHRLAQDIQPLNEQKDYLERLVISVDQHILRIEALLLQF